MQRTHRLRADRDWLPTGVRRASKLVRGAVWTGAGAVVASAVAAVPATLLLWKALVIGGAGLAVAGDRAARAMLQRQVARMTRGEIELASLSKHAEGELVVVRGTIAADTPLRGVLVETEGVYRRLVLEARGTWVHEAAVDFSLVDDTGHHILVQAAGARWIVPPRERVIYPGMRFRADHVPPQVRALGARPAGRSPSPIRHSQPGADAAQGRVCGLQGRRCIHRVTTGHGARRLVSRKRRCP